MVSSSVLLAIDNCDERELYTTALPMYGFEVRCVGELNAVESSTAAVRPDVLVLNVRLNDEAWSLLERIQCGSALNVPCVLLTGSVRADEANRLRARASGCAAFVAKPCTPQDLSTILRAVIAGARGLIVMNAEGFDGETLRCARAEPAGGGGAAPPGRRL